MKYIVVLGDGMADEPIEELGGKTPLEFAKTETMDEMSAVSEVGMVHTIPEGMSPGSDTANLSVIGYDPKIYYTGRSPLEALSIGVDMKDTDVALRCNIVTVTDNGEPYEDKVIVDHSSSEISTEDAAVLLEAVKKELETEEFAFYLGTSYRHLTIWDKGQVIELTPPHDILGRKIGEYLPGEKAFYEMQKRSFDILNNHPLNIERAKNGLNKANSLWFWGAGTRPALSSFEEKNNKKGAMISAVDLLKGIATGAGMKVVEVEGANGGLNTNYEGKAQAAVKELLENNMDFVYIHLEGPDEMGHQGSCERKIKAIENLDSRIIKPVKEALDKSGEEYRMVILPDHPTPVSVRTHTSDAVPYMLYDSRKKADGKALYNEKEASQTGRFISDGYKLMDYFLEKNEQL